jgi:hypothetical protein
MHRTYAVQAHWDDLAEVWFSSSDIAGLVIEAVNLEDFQRLVIEQAPIMLAEHEGLHHTQVVVELKIEERRLHLPVA